MSWRMLKTLAWLQWRLTVNRLRQGGHRDTVERVSRISEIAVVVILGLLTVPLAIALAAGAALAGWTLAAGDASTAAIVVAATAVVTIPVVWVVLRPVFSVGEARSGSPTLLRLLPVPASVFRNLELLRSLLDPMVLLFVPPLLLLPLGMIAGGAVTGGLLAAAAGILLVALVAALGSTVSLSIQLVARRRGRAELVTLAVILLLTVSGFLPQLFVHRASQTPPSRPAATAAAADTSPSALPSLVRYSPPGLYGTSLAAAARADLRGAALPLALLVVAVVGLVAASRVVLGRLLTSPAGGVGGRRPGTRTTATRWRIPGLSQPAVALGVAEARAHLRTVRGKIALVTPALMIALMTVAFRQPANGQLPVSPGNLMLGFVAFAGPLGLATFSVNQFAVLRGGQLLEAVLPVSPQRLLTGKLVATTMLVVLATAAGAAVLLLADPGVRRPYVLAAVLVGLAAHIAMTPVAAILSALFPKPVELSAIGRGSQPHGLAVLVNMLGTLLATLPAAALAAGAVALTRRAWLAPAVAVLALALAALVARLALPLAARVFVARGENIALVASGH